MFDPLIFVTVRDRVTDLRQLVDWLERAGHERIVLLDNSSTYEPLIEYLKASPHDVRPLTANHGARCAWIADQIPAGEWFVVTDPDILPIEACPLDLIATLHHVLLEHHQFSKAGPGLYLDDIGPKDFLNWEQSLVAIASDEFPNPRGRELAPGVFDSLIDTTFALHRPGTQFQYDAIRTGYPCQARHLSWYREDNPTAEDRFYLEHAIAGPTGSSWAQRVYAHCD
jgi:hypothetical protein